MGTLAISAANLDTLENNMVILNNNINAVTSDIININGQISTFNQDVSEMKANIKSLEEEIRDFMADIRGTTLVSNAQNDILLKENELNKKYGNYDIIRRQISGLLESININLVSKKTLTLETEKILFNAPNYYLSYALIAISAWFSNDKKKANSALNEALKLNAAKTSLLLCFVHLHLKREQTALKWMKKYLESQNPYELDNEFISVIDALTSGVYSKDITDIIYSHIKKYANNLSSDEQLINRCVKRFETFFSKKKVVVNDYEYPNLVKFTNNFDNIKKSLVNAKSYYDAYYEFNRMIENVKNTKSPDLTVLLNNFVNSYEDKELELKKDILKDKLIINNNGNIKKANETFEDSNLAYENKTDFYTLMTNILLERNDVSKITKKLAASFLKDIIKKGLNNALASGNEVSGLTTISINEWSGSTMDGSNENELKESLKDYLRKPYDRLLAECNLFDVKIILTILGAIIGLILAIGFNYIIGLAVIIISLILLFFFANSIFKKRDFIEKEYNEVEKKVIIVLENIIAEIVDSHFTVKRAKENYDYIINYLNSFDDKTYIS